MELIKHSHKKSTYMLPDGGVSGPSGYELQLSGSGYTQVWKGKVKYSGMLEMLGGTYFHQLQFFSPNYPVMYLNFVFPKKNFMTEGEYAIQEVSYEESGTLDKPVTEFFLHNKEEGLPDPAQAGNIKIQLGRNGYAISGDIEANVCGRRTTAFRLKGKFWLDEWNCFPIQLLSAAPFN